MLRLKMDVNSLSAWRCGSDTWNGLAGCGFCSACASSVAASSAISAVVSRWLRLLTPAVPAATTKLAFGTMGSVHGMAETVASSAGVMVRAMWPNAPPSL